MAAAFGCTIGILRPCLDFDLLGFISKPTTGKNVQTWSGDDLPADDGCPFVSLRCPACVRPARDDAVPCPQLAKAERAALPEGVRV